MFTIYWDKISDPLTHGLCVYNFPSSSLSVAKSGGFPQGMEGELTAHHSKWGPWHSSGLARELSRKAEAQALPQNSGIRSAF